MKRLLDRREPRRDRAVRPTRPSLVAGGGALSYGTGTPMVSARERAGADADGMRIRRAPGVWLTAIAAVLAVVIVTAAAVAVRVLDGDEPYATAPPDAPAVPPVTGTLSAPEGVSVTTAGRADPGTPVPRARAGGIAPPRGVQDGHGRRHQ